MLSSYSEGGMCLVNIGIYGCLGTDNDCVFFSVVNRLVPLSIVNEGQK